MKTIDQIKKEAKNRDKLLKESEKDNLFEIRGGKIVLKTVADKPELGNRKKRRAHLRLPKLRASRLNYREYIQSRAWARRKSLFYRKYRRQCSACYSHKFIQVHHMIYRKKLFGIEPDSHLVALCTDCHREFHEKNGTHQNMLQMTHKFIKWKLENRSSL